MTRAAIRLALAAGTVAIAACSFEARQQSAGSSRPDGGTPERYGFGRPASNEQVAALDTDVDGRGNGLPPGRGDAATGAALYRAKCASCHGANGEGIAPNPQLVGREPRDSFPFGNDKNLVRTIGNYWPYAAPLFDYIRRAMPHGSAGTLTDDEVYSLTAHLLAANELIPAGSALDAASLAAVRMPVEGRFVRDNRRGGNEVR